LMFRPFAADCIGLRVNEIGHAPAQAWRRPRTGMAHLSAVLIRAQMAPIS